MASKDKKSQKDQQKKSAEKKQTQKEEKVEKKPYKHDDENSEVLLRIAGFDIGTSRKVMPGLTKIKGVGWAISNAICKILKIPKDKKIGELSKEDIAQIETFLKNLEVKEYMMNRRNDLETGESKHYFGSDLDMKKDFDIRRLKKIRSYKGVRHTNKLPVRGQRTRSHFRKKGQAVRVRKK